VRAQYLAATEADRRNIQLDVAVKEAMASEYDNHPHRQDHRLTTAWTAWCKETGQEVAQVHDDDLEIQTGGDYKNRRCNLTTKDIFELDDPVEDRHGFIWEREALVAFIRKAGGQTKNPARPDVMITETELKPCRRVKRAAAKRRKEQESQAATQAEDVL
jgi:hypothetical protein